MSLTPDEVLERTQWDFFWVPPDVTIVDRPEVAYLCSSRDQSMFNTVTRTRAQPHRLAALVEEVAAAHAQVGSRWLVPPTVDVAALERALSAGGYSPAHVHDGYVLPVDRHLARPTSGLRVVRVETESVLRDCIAVAGSAFGDVREPTEAQLSQELAQCTTENGRVHRYVAYGADGKPVASGGMSTFPSLGIGLLFAGATVPEARGRGAYSAVLTARIEAARRLGLSSVGLYARIETSAPIVARQGFERHGPMVYWDRAR